MRVFPVNCGSTAQRDVSKEVGFTELVGRLQTAPHLLQTNHPFGTTQAVTRLQAH